MGTELITRMGIEDMKIIEVTKDGKINRTTLVALFNHYCIMGINEFITFATYVACLRLKGHKFMLETEEMENMEDEELIKRAEDYYG